eukprot:NODE_1299_length_977_cov_264.217672_g997_i0.p1 GENE.NODE_1299_length_977_cov_264.217672_g997_i0~~NODE_1299_length_977_cov_264.217672_g997_i0.p1  ORF type:complete len:270 (-),score=49.46 NODE_1299_length_977_cov_264.217672_g997_i0:166-918(-)
MQRVLCQVAPPTVYLQSLAHSLSLHTRCGSSRCYSSSMQATTQDVSRSAPAAAAVARGQLWEARARMQALSDCGYMSWSRQALVAAELSRELLTIAAQPVFHYELPDDCDTDVITCSSDPEPIWDSALIFVAEPETLPSEDDAPLPPLFLPLPQLCLTFSNKPAVRRFAALPNLELRRALELVYGTSIAHLEPFVDTSPDNSKKNHGPSFLITFPSVSSLLFMQYKPGNWKLGTQFSLPPLVQKKLQFSK